MHFKKIHLLSLFALSFIFSCKKDESSSLTPSTPTTIDAATTTSLSSSLAITGIKATSGKAYVLGTLAKSSTYYMDRTNLATTVPDSLSGLPLIKTANDDKANTSTSFLSFTLTNNSTVYVGYDARGTALPAWLSGWKKLSAKIVTDDAKMGSFVLYSKSYNAGTVTLGGAMASPAKGALCNYIVFAKSTSTAGNSTQPVTSSFIFGVNSHPTRVGYAAVGIDQQIALLKQMGMTYFRQDISFNTDGTMSSLNKFIPIYNAAKAAGISILPMVYTSTLDLTKSESANYTAGRAKGSAVATKNSQYFKYYELGNELDLKVILSGNGDKNTDYDLKKFKLVAAYFKGMDEGIKSVQPTAKTMIDGSWLHFAYMQMLLDYGVNIDIVAWHWYSDMETAAPRNSMKITDITAKLAALFSKPIWFTEVGQRWTNVSNIDQIQSDFITSFYKKAKANPRVGALFLYELFDEPAIAPSNIQEANYGLVKWTSAYTKWQAKTVVNNLSVK